MRGRKGKRGVVRRIGHSLDSTIKDIQKKYNDRGIKITYTEASELAAIKRRDYP